MVYNYFHKKRLIAGVASAIAISLSCSLQADTETHKLKIKSQDVGPALMALGEEAGVEIVLTQEVGRSIKLAGISGEYTLNDALEQMLNGTGLKYEFLSDESVIIQQSTTGGDGRSADKDNSNTGREIEDIIITASRREQALQDVSMAVTAISPDEFTSIGLTTLTDVIAYTPGVSTQSAGGFPVGGTNITVRGISALGGGGSATATTSVYMDGTALTSNSPFGGGSFLNFDGLLGDVERVEFLKGPQGTLYGATAIGGAIKYITRKPSLDETNGLAAVNLSTTQHGGFSKVYNGRISTPLIEDKLGITLAGFFDDGAGLVDNVNATTGAVEQKDADSYEQYGFSADLFYKFSDDFDFRGRVLHQSAEFNGLSILTLRPGVTEHIDPPFSNSNGAQSHTMDSTFYTGTFTVQFEGATLEAVSSFVENNWLVNRDLSQLSELINTIYIGGPTGTITSVPVLQDVGAEKFTQEIRLTSESSETLEWMAGLYYADEETLFTNVATAEPGGYLLGDLDNPSFYKETAIFGNVTYYVTPEFDLTLGTRLSKSELTYHPTNRTVTPLFNTATDFIDKTSGTVDTWSLSVRYRPVESLSLYSRVASGYRPGTLDISPLGQVSRVRPDSLWSYEVGIKGDFADGIASYDLALWYVEWEDFQVGIPVPGGLVISNATGGITANGFEGSITFNPLDALSIITNISYTESTLNENEPNINGLKGQQLPYVPEWKFSSRARYDFILADHDAQIGLGLRYEDSSRSAFTDGMGRASNLPTDSYVAVDLNGSVTWDQLTLGLYATNLLNEGAVHSTSDVFGLTQGVALKPRTLGVRLAMDF